MSSAVNFVFTWYTATTILWSSFFDLEKVRYFIVQLEECPTTGKKHYQGYVQIHKKHRVSTIGKFLDMLGAHFEIAKGTVKDNQTYCSKEETRYAGPWEGGTPSFQGDRTDLAHFAAVIRKHKGDMRAIFENCPESTIRYNRAAKELGKLYAPGSSPTPKKREPPQVIVLWGKSGSGKTRTARELAGETDESEAASLWTCPAQDHISWYDGYCGQEFALFDDFEPSQMGLSKFLQITDRYLVTVPVKGGFTSFHPLFIVFTANTDPATWYSDQYSSDKLAAVARRINAYEIKSYSPDFIRDILGLDEKEPSVTPSRTGSPADPGTSEQPTITSEPLDQLYANTSVPSKLTPVINYGAAVLKCGGNTSGPDPKNLVSCPLPRTSTSDTLYKVPKIDNLCESSTTSSISYQRVDNVDYTITDDEITSLINQTYIGE